MIPLSKDIAYAQRLLPGSYQRSSCRPLIPVILDGFEIEGPNGHHQCIVTAPAKSSVSAALFYCYSHIETAHVLTAKLALAVAYVHAQGYVHGGK